MSIANSWRTISLVLKEQSVGTFNSLNTPVSNRDITRLERAFSLKLPATYLKSMKIHNGTKGHDFLNDMSLLDANGVLDWLDVQRDVQSLYEFGGRKTTAKSKTRNDERWRDKWLPIAADAGGNLVIIDLDPGPAGNRGQVVRWNNVGGPNHVLSKSFAIWLKLIATELLQGRYSKDEYGGICLNKSLL